MKRVSADRYVWFTVLALGGLAWDLYSKSAVFSDLGPRRMSEWSYRLFGGWITFRLQTSFNPGALWGIGQDLTWIFTALSFVAVAGVLYWQFFRGASRSLWLTSALAFVLAGTLGNLYDRLALHGYSKQDGGSNFAVRDFLAFTFGNFNWPVFNFADVFLVTGAIMLVLHSFRPESPPDERPATSDETSMSSRQTGCTSASGQPTSVRCAATPGHSPVERS